MTAIVPSRSGSSVVIVDLGLGVVGEADGVDGADRLPGDEHLVARDELAAVLEQQVVAPPAAAGEEEDVDDEDEGDDEGRERGYLAPSQRPPRGAVVSSTMVNGPPPRSPMPGVQPLALALYGARTSSPFPAEGSAPAHHTPRDRDPKRSPCVAWVKPAHARLALYSRGARPVSSL